jgi:hypothetical protein
MRHATIQRAPIRLHRFAGSSSADTSPKTNAKLESKILIPNHQVPVSASIVGASCERRGLGAGQKARLTFGPGPPGAIRAALRGVKISWREYRGDAALLLLVLLASCHYYSDAVGSPGSFALFLQACRATHASPLLPRIAWRASYEYREYSGVVRSPCHCLSADAPAGRELLLQKRRPP